MVVWRVKGIVIPVIKYVMVRYRTTLVWRRATICSQKRTDFNPKHFIY